MPSSSRLRIPFSYPSSTTTPSTSSTSSTSHTPPRILDETEQDQLIARLALQNSTRNTQFTYLLLALPVLSSIPYLLALGGVRTLMFGVLGLTSLGASGWIVLQGDEGRGGERGSVSGWKVLDVWVLGDGRDNTRVNVEEDNGDVGGGTSRRRQPLSLSTTYTSPLEQYLPRLNAALCGILVLYGLIAPPSRSMGGGWSSALLACLPAAVYAAIVTAKLVMASIDPERELNRLKYEYKGA